jgi:hypothetical protein
MLIEREKIRMKLQQEEKLFEAEHPQSAKLYVRAQDSLLGGVPIRFL